MVLALESIVFMILVIDQSGHGHADMVKGYPHLSIIKELGARWLGEKFALCLTFACSGNAANRKILF